MTALNLQEKILQKFKTSELLQGFLQEACKLETEFEQGQSFGDKMFYKAEINSSTGLWSMIFETSIGNIYCNELETPIQKIEIITVHKQGKTNIYTSKMNDLKSLKSLQQKLMEDPIFSRMLVDSYGNKSAAEVFIFLFRRFRKDLLSYQRTFDFLWEKTSFNNALDLNMAFKKA